LHTNPLFYAQVEHAGILLIFIAIFGRTWSALHIGGHKKVALVETGPYSVVRNPLYVFTLIGVAGIGAQTSSLVVAGLCTSITAAVLIIVVLKEEDYLRAKFGAAFDDYARRVPRFMPSFSAYRDVEELTIRPKIVYRTFLESSLFLISIPAIDAIELARHYGWLPDVLHLP
jgi:steroid 5-alpha reductase family enzyme